MGLLPRRNQGSKGDTSPVRYVIPRVKGGQRPRTEEAHKMEDCPTGNPYCNCRG